jgi:hypothetical protein
MGAATPIPEEGTIEQGDLTVDYSSDAQKSVELPAGYPKDLMPVFENAFVTVVSTLGSENSFMVSAFCKEPVQEVGAFYKDFLKDTEIIMSMDEGNEFSIVGNKGNYAYQVVVMESSEMEADGYSTALIINLTPNQ